MPDFRRGAAAIAKAEEASKGGNFRPFVPEIKWREDGEEKYLLFLNNVDDIPLVSLHTFIPVGTGQKANGEAYTKYEQFISRTDPGIGEDHDPLTEKGSTPADVNMGVAVELEPIMKTVRGRARPAGFKVKTVEFDRKTDDGTETVVAPVVGIVAQKPGNFYGYLRSYSEKDGPIEEQAFGITRRGVDKNTTYDFQDFLEAEIDLTDLIENITGVSYLNDVADDMLSDMAQTESPQEQAKIIGAWMLDTRLTELSDLDRYKELTDHITEIIPKYGKKDNKNGGGKSNRPERPSQRQASESSAPADDAARKDKFAKIRERAAQKNAEAAA